MSFSKDFLWGAASAAAQIEGASLEDGKTAGIWDALYEGHTLNNENCSIACDHYHRYKEDVALLKELGVQTYRFSISWPRIVPERGRINEKGLAFYSDLVDELKASGIEPMVTLYHWNLPMWAHEAGGWGNPEILEDFRFYTEAVTDALSDRVKYWMTFNEPACFIGLGYIVGTHAPFEKVDFSDIEAVGIRAGSLTRNVLLCHGEAVQILRKRAKLPPVIGMAINGDLQEPAFDTPEDIEAARAATFSGLSFFNTNWWCDPAILGTAPDALKPFLSAEDLEKICQPLDFFGFNCYQNSNYAGSGGGQVPPVGYAHTDMGWPITPNVLYWAAKFFWERYHLPFLITENGMANLDFVMLDGKVHDPQRIDFMHRYIAGLQKAADEGVPVMGYTAWSVMDNYEWAEGYLRRFGLIYVDYKTQERIPKDSFWWYKDVIRKNGVDM